MTTKNPPTCYVLTLYRDSLEGVFSSISAAAAHLFENTGLVNRDTGEFICGVWLSALELDAGRYHDEAEECTSQLKAECIRLAEKRVQLAAQRVKKK